MAGRHHHGQQQGSQGGGIGHGRARQRRHHHGRHNGHITEATFDVAHQGKREVHNAPRQTAGVHHFTGEHEKRHGQQRKTVSAIDDVLRQDLRVEHAHVPHQGGATQEQ